MDISKNMKFFEICEMLEKIKSLDGTAQKEKKIRQTIDSFRDFSKEFRKTHGEDCNSSFYCVLRCLLPLADTSRGSYGVKYSSLGQIYIKNLQLPVGGRDADRLIHRNIRSSVHGDHEDYADVVYGVLKTRTTNTPSDLSLFDIHTMLDTIASEDRKSVERIVTSLSETASALEQKWFVRLLLKRMNLGIGEARILAILHPKAKDFYSRCSDLEAVCIAIESGDELCLQNSITPFNHIKPMLCEQLEMDSLYPMMGKDTLYVETKMDGERFQLHMKDETFKYMSRNGIDYTKFFGKDHTEGNLTPLIVGLLETHVKNVILDGEMMVWDKESACYRVKGENFDVKHLQLGGNLRPCFVAYDLLYLNDTNYVDFAYSDRIEKLKSCFKEEPGVLCFGKRTKLCTLPHFIDIFNDALDANEEGVVVKLRGSTYQPGSRSGGWFKVKADYIRGIISDMDMVIMGGCYNRTKAYISSYFVGVVQGGEDDATLHCVGKVGSGLSIAERTTLNSSLSSKWKKGFTPKHLRFGLKSPDLWIEPKDSIVLQLKASELGQASSFATPYSLRFPRIEAIRSDKPWYECMTLEQYEVFYKGDHGVKKINKRQLKEQDMTTGKKAKPSTIKSKSWTTVYSNAFDRGGVQVESTVFEDFNFCILSPLRGSHSINNLKEMVVRNGGKIVENPSPTDHTCICIAGDLTYRVEKLCQTGHYNVVSCNWLVDATERKRMQLKPRDMISMTAEMKEQFKVLYDSHGDSYTDHVDVDELKIILGELNSTSVVPLLQEHEMTSLEDEIYGPDSSPNFFRDFKAVFYNVLEHDKCDTLTHDATVAKLTYQWRGGTCPDLSSPDGCKKTKFVFADLHGQDMKSLEMWFLVTFTKRLLKVKVVSIDWITDSDRAGQRLPIDNYLIKFN